MKYLFILYTSFKRQLAYRFDVVIGFLLVVIVAVSSRFFWMALSAAGKIPEAELARYITYSVMAAILSSIFISELIAVVSDKIRWGIVTTDLQKPVDFQMLSLAESFGEMLGNFLIKFIPSLIFMKLVLNIYLPPSPVTWLCFAASAFLGYCILVTFDYLVSLLAFYFVEIWAFQAIKTVIIGFCSGMYLPLWLFPDSVLSVFNVLPFKYFLFVPLNIYLGIVSGGAVLLSLFEQVLWILGLFGAGKIFTWIALKRLTVAGG